MGGLEANLCEEKLTFLQRGVYYITQTFHLVKCNNQFEDYTTPISGDNNFKDLKFFILI